MFRRRYQLFEYAMILFNLINESTTFQNLMNKTLEKSID